MEKGKPLDSELRKTLEEHTKQLIDNKQRYPQSVREITKHLGVSHTTVYKILNQLQKSYKNC